MGMNRTRLAALSLLSFLALIGLHSTAQQSGSRLGEREGWTLTFQDEFSEPYNTAVDASKWGFEFGANGWGNNELQFYTNTRRNAIQDGSGRLLIRARQEPKDTPYVCAYAMPCEYTSARLLTRGIFSQRYGRFEARMRVPVGQGLWPAFWLLGANFAEVGWPQSGEIDIMENIGREPTLAHGTIHGPGYSGAQALGTPVSLASNARFTDGFHVFAVEWQQDEIRWYLDDQLYATRTPKDLPQGSSWVFDEPMYLILNLAVGGDWPGNPDQTTAFPANLLVDYVRVYTKN